MATLPLTEANGGLGSYEALLNRLIRQSEESRLAMGEARGPVQVGGHVTLGFGYDLATRKDKSRPYWILSDLASADIELTIAQLAAVLFYVGQSRDDIEHYLDDLAVHGTAVTPGDRRFVQKLSDFDRTDKGLFANLQGVTVSRAQGEALLKAVVEVKEALFEAFLWDKENVIPQDVRDQLKAHSDQRAVLVDMFYQSADLLGPKLRSALSAGDAAAAALEIAFLSNKTPGDTPGMDARSLERAKTFFGAALAPRTPAEAEAFLHAIAQRSDALALALAKRQGDPSLEQAYFEPLNAVVKASLRRFGLDAAVEFQSDGHFNVIKEVPLDTLAQAFGLSPRALALANPDVFPTPPEGFAKFPAGKTLHLPARQAPPRRGHASLGVDELLTRLSPAALAALEADAWRIPPELELAAARYDVPELAALPAFDLGIDLPKLAAAYDFSATPGPDWLPSLLLPEPRHTESFAPDFPITPRHGVNQAVLARIAASFERCERAVEELDRQIDSWIERRNALRRRRGFD